LYTTVLYVTTLTDGHQSPSKTTCLEQPRCGCLVSNYCSLQQAQLGFTSSCWLQSDLTPAQEAQKHSQSTNIIQRRGAKQQQSSLVYHECTTQSLLSLLRTPPVTSPQLLPSAAPHDEALTPSLLSPPPPLAPQHRTCRRMGDDHRFLRSWEHPMGCPDIDGGSAFEPRSPRHRRQNESC